jgi:hypothetical protein
MTLVFSLLQKDYSILALDSRHTRGDPERNYKNDSAIKTVEILDGRGVLGFAGDDFGEQIVFPAKRDGLLDKPENDLQTTAFELSKFVEEKYALFRVCPSQPVIEILMTGFQSSGKETTATAYRLSSPLFSPNVGLYPYLRFEAIGRSKHGALYGLHRFANQDLPLEAGLRLSGLVLFEICECDTTSGGNPQLYVIPKNGKCYRHEPVSPIVQWAHDWGTQTQRLLLSGEKPLR